MSQPIEPQLAELEANSQLRQVLASHELCRNRFKEAQDLTLSLFDPLKPPQPKSVIPFFTDHSPSHFIRIEKYVNEILFPKGHPDQSDQWMFIPSVEEAMYLLSAVWLHDIGMICGILPQDDLGADTNWEDIRDTHEVRTANYITRYWAAHCSWEAQEKQTLAELCVHHRRKYDFKDMDLAEVEGAIVSPVRLRELAAILRLADACHTDITRAPSSLRNLYTAIGMPSGSLTHWSRPSLIKKISFDHSKREIQLRCEIPRDTDFGTARVDFRPVIHKVIKGLRDELASVEPFLGRYSNTAFHKVEPVFVYPRIYSEPRIQMCELWPDLLSSVHSASEAACMIAALVDAFLVTTQGVNMPLKQIEELLTHSLQMYRFNILVRNLVQEIKDQLADAQQKMVSHSELRRFLTNYLDSRVKACLRTAELAASQMSIAPNDWLVVYGYSHSIMTLFRKHLRTHRGPVLVVEYRQQTRDGELCEEAARVYSELTEIGLACTFVRLESLPLLFNHCKNSAPKQSLVVILGTRGIYNMGKSLSGAGNAVIALAAHQFGGKVYILADQGKRTHDKEVENSIDEALHEVVEVLISGHAAEVPEPSESSLQIDVIPSHLFNLILDDEGPTKAATTLVSVD